MDEAACKIVLAQTPSNGRGSGCAFGYDRHVSSDSLCVHSYFVEMIMSSKSCGDNEVRFYALDA